MKKNIFRVACSYYPAKSMGGAVTADYELDKAIAKAGHHVEVFTTNAGLEESNILGSKRFDGVHVNFFKYSLGRNISISFGLIISFIISILRKRNECCVVFSGVWNIPNIVCPVFCRWIGISYYMVPHGSLMSNVVNVRKSIIKKILYWLFVKRNIKNANGLHFTTQIEKEQSIDYIGYDPVCDVFPLGFNFEDFILPTDKDLSEFSTKYKVDSKFNIFFIGRINWKKGLDILFQAINKVDAEWKLFCVGPDDENYSAILLASLSQEMKKKVTFTGNLTGVELACAYNLADLFVLTSYSENFGMSVVESSFYNKPSLITNDVGVACYYKDGLSVIIVETNPISIRNKMEYFMSNKESLLLIGENAKKNALSLFSVDHVSKKFLNIIRC